MDCYQPTCLIRRLLASLKLYHQLDHIIQIRLQPPDWMQCSRFIVATEQGANSRKEQTIRTMGFRFWISDKQADVADNIRIQE